MHPEAYKQTLPTNKHFQNAIYGLATSPVKTEKVYFCYPSDSQLCICCTCLSYDLSSDKCIVPKKSRTANKYKGYNTAKNVGKNNTSTVLTKEVSKPLIPS